MNGVLITQRDCCDVCFYDIICTFVDYNKKRKKCTYNYVYNFTCVFVYISRAIKIYDNNIKHLYTKYNLLKWMPKQKRARGRPKKNWMEGKKKAMNERNLNEGQWEDRKQWSLGVGQCRKTF